MCILDAGMARDIIAFAEPSMLPSVSDKSKIACNYGDENTPKARKPYTITKQREKWTDEEHEKFLEAVKLYGRSWRKIEEHVGTKTAIQIRSHAQKFFTKVVRDSGGSSTPIVIPPPRPKRRPNHPYPRKLSIVPPTKLAQSSSGVERFTLEIGSVFDQEKESPTSVLSLAGSEVMSSHTSNVANHSTSSDTSAMGSGASVGHGNEISCEVDRPLADEDIQLSANKQSMVSQNNAPLRSFQLFGTVVMIANPQIDPSPDAGNTIPDLIPNQANLPAAGKANQQIPTQATKPSATPTRPNTNCSCGLLPFFYPGQEMATPLTWVPFFGNHTIPQNRSLLANSQWKPHQQVATQVGTKAEESGTSSNSSTEEMTRKKTLPPLTPPSQAESPKAKGFLPYKRHQTERDPKLVSSSDQKGFVPYKQPEIGEDRDHKRIKLS